MFLMQVRHANGAKRNGKDVATLWLSAAWNSFGAWKVLSGDVLSIRYE